MGVDPSKIWDFLAALTKIPHKKMAPLQNYTKKETASSQVLLCKISPFTKFKYIKNSLHPSYS